MTLSEAEIETYRSQLLVLHRVTQIDDICSRIINQDMAAAVDFLPNCSIDLLILDPPYNLDKNFGNVRFSSRTIDAYESWMENWFQKLIRLLKPTSSIYVCGDWRSSTAIHRILDRYMIIRNRITWEREKGRGARTNWKNSSEDIWFATVTESYTFNVNSVMHRRSIVAPYRDELGDPKDWEHDSDGDYRLTYPSNLWTDLTVPFWSMRENTSHPTQKPEKLLAKMILASSNHGDVVLDPFLGSGTTAVVAKKLGRRSIGIEIDERFCCLAEKRLRLAERDQRIQGYEKGVFWPRNASKNRMLVQRREAEASIHSPLPGFGREEEIS